MIELRTLTYFAQQNIDPYHLLFKVLNEKTHPQHENLMTDLSQIDPVELHEFITRPDISFLIDKKSMNGLDGKGMFLVYKLRSEIFRLRVQWLTEANPDDVINSRNFEGIEIDKHNMISTRHFDSSYKGFQRNGLAYDLCPVVSQANSSHWVFQEILNCQKSKGVNFQIRLNPFFEASIERYQPMSYKMWVYGKPVDWNRLKSIRNDEDGRWMNDDRQEMVTDFVWSPKDDELSFTCEEYPSSRYNGIAISRYFHAIFNKQTGKIKHCDGAIRVYDEYELSKRYQFHIKHPDVRKVGKRVKIFQFDSTENDGIELSNEDFSNIALCFFVWNADIENYFS